MYTPWQEVDQHSTAQFSHLPHFHPLLLSHSHYLLQRRLLIGQRHHNPSLGWHHVRKHLNCCHCASYLCCCFDHLRHCYLDPSDGMATALNLESWSEIVCCLFRMILSSFSIADPNRIVVQKLSWDCMQVIPKWSLITNLFCMTSVSMHRPIIFAALSSGNTPFLVSFSFLTYPWYFFLSLVSCYFSIN